MHEDQKFLEMVVKALVDHPESVVINRTVDEMGVLLSLKVHADDMGKIIGRSGNTAKAIRTLLRVVGMKIDARVNLKVDEPEGGRRESVPAADLAEANEMPAEVASNGSGQVSDADIDAAIDGLKI
ncbi:hypothetical protein A3C87_02030 [Candidatus Kaiserbacteria bacterium RIFCSPHIGHO2_02_FULL_49_34]|uniref:RNA-binding protein KhpA n=1 Tax=Candidatus Kaiserbacteria bacterium RIFCSPHIGHO2_02_FULL_49_34 TaxID=1798491 RepID=A0A1F6DIA8_9BACT|nr:MAG: hypothetical protein A3C87_02030 [Candidatus Kaiserbacteria bacterium RIFCSPHIGHO2_02_FULL_49_34]